MERRHQARTPRPHRFGPTVAGYGKGVPKQVSQAQSTQSIVDFIVGHDLTDIVLVGHSYGGTIISKAGEVIYDRIRRLVFWNAFVLNDGESMADAAPPHYRALFELAAASPDNTVMLPFRDLARSSSTTGISIWRDGPTPSYRPSRFSSWLSPWICGSSTP